MGHGMVISTWNFTPSYITWEIKFLTSRSFMVSFEARFLPLGALQFVIVKA